MSYKGITKEDLETMRRNGMSFGEEQQLFWEKEDYLEVDKDKEIERLNNIINELEKDIDLELYKTRANDEYNKGLFNAFRYVKDKLQELKGSDKE